MITSHTLKKRTSRADTGFEKATMMRSHLKTLQTCRTMDMRKGRICLTFKNNEHLSRILNNNINFIIKIYCSTLNGETDLSFHVQWIGLTLPIGQVKSFTGMQYLCIMLRTIFFHSLRWSAYHFLTRSPPPVYL